MFDQDINFLPPEIAKKEKKEKAADGAKAPVNYLDPANPADKEQAVKIKTLRPKFAYSLSRIFRPILNFFSKKSAPAVEPKKEPPKIAFNPLAVKSPKETSPKTFISSVPSKKIAPLQTIKISAPQSLPPKWPVDLPKTASFPGNQPLPPIKPLPEKPLSPQPTSKPEPEKFESKADVSKNNFPQKSAPAKDKNFAVNLLPEELAIAAAFKRKLIFSGLILLFAAILVAGGFLFIRLYSSTIQASPSNAQSIAIMEEKIKDYEEYHSRSQAVSQKVNLVSSLIKNHRYWSKIFPKIEKITYANVLYSSFMADDTGQVALEAVAPDFFGLAQQVMILESSEDLEKFEYSNINLDSAEEASSSIAFDLILKFAPETLLISQSN